MKNIALSWLLISYIHVFAQQEQQYSMYMVNQFVLNPAIAGTEDFIDINAGYRTQWVALEGAPVTYYLSVHGTVGKPYNQYHRIGEHKAWHGVGGYVYEDKTGGIARFSFLLSYAYNMPLNKHTRLSAGMFGGFKQLSTNAGHWKNIDDPTDNLFSSSLNTGLTPDLQLGLVLYRKELFINLSLFQVLGNNVNLLPASNETNFNQSTLSQHLFINSGYKFQLSEHSYLTPSFMMKAVKNTPISLDLNLKYAFDSKYWLGISHRYLESINVFSGINFERKIDVSYAFEWSITKIDSFNKGTHEIIIGYRLNHPANITCPSKYW